MSLSPSKIERLMPPYVVWTIVAIAAHLAATALLFVDMAHGRETARAPIVSALSSITASKT